MVVEEAPSLFLLTLRVMDMKRGKFNRIFVGGTACLKWILLYSFQFRIAPCGTVKYFLKFGQRIKGADENIWLTTDTSKARKEEISYFAPVHRYK